MSARLELLKDTLATAAENYKDNVRAFAVLDEKAQRTGTIAGVFLAAWFAFIRPETIGSLTRSIGSPATSSLTGVVLLLMFCFLLSLLTMWVGTASPPLNLAHMTEMTDDLLHFSEAELVQDMLEANYGERIAVWTKCIEGQKDIGTRKRVIVFLAQLALLLAILWAAYLWIDLLHAASAGVFPIEWIMCYIFARG